LANSAADQKWFGARQMSCGDEVMPNGKIERSIYDDAISLINEPIQPERREEAIRESAVEIARKRWGMEVRSKPGVASQSADLICEERR
jgi:hypothetical protein